jgi:multiple sugar transport system substrate-binding protein
MRAQFNALLLWLLLLALPACTTAATPAAAPSPTTAPTPPPDKITITWGYWGDPWEVEINKRVIEVFEADNPNIRIEAFHRPYDQYFKELRPKLDSGEPVPDVFFWSEAPIDVPKGYFMDLTPLIEGEGYALDDFFEGLLVHFNIPKKGIYGLPRDSDTKVIFYNKRLFNQAGLSYPKSDWTWDDLRNNALALKKANVAPYSFAFEPNSWWMIWMWQNGVQLFDDKLFPSKTDLGNPAAAEAVQFFADLTNVDQVTPPYEQMLDSANIAALFKEGKLAMAFGNHALVPAFAEVKDLEWDVVGLPQKVRRANVAAGAGYVISAKTTQPEAAWTFLKFLSGFKGQAIFAESGVAVPARISVAKSEVFMEQKPDHNAQVFLDEANIGEPTPAFPGSNDIIELVNNALTPVWQGQQDAASAINQILPQVEDIVAKQQLKR